MRAISLWQPWASAIALGAKRVETRSWPTNYRGPLFIHAAKRCVVSELIYFSCCWNWCGAMAGSGLRMGGGVSLGKLLPFGALVATAMLTDCRPTASFTQAELDTPREPTGIDAAHLYRWTERHMGDFSIGRYGWVLDKVMPLPEPIPWRGAQGFFNVPDEVLLPAVAGAA